MVSRRKINPLLVLFLPSLSRALQSTPAFSVCRWPSTSKTWKSTTPRSFLLPPLSPPRWPHLAEASSKTRLFQSTNPNGNNNQTDRYAYYERSPSANKSNGDYYYKQQPKATSFMSAVSKQMVNDRRKWNRPVGGGVAPGASAAGAAGGPTRPGQGPGPGPPQQPFGRPLYGPNATPSRSVHYKDPTHYRQPDFQRSALEQDGNYYYEQQPKATSYMSSVAKNMEGVPRQYWKSEGRTRTRPVHEAGNGGVGGVGASAAGRRARMRRSGNGPGVNQMRDMQQRQLRQQQFMEREQRRRELRNKMTRPPPSPQYYEPDDIEEFDYQLDNGRSPPPMNFEDEDDGDDYDFYYDDDGEDFDDDDDDYDGTPRYDTKRKPRRKNRSGRFKSTTSRRRQPQRTIRYDDYEEDDDEETYFSTAKSKRKIGRDNDDTDEGYENYFRRTNTRKNKGPYMPSQKENLSNSININIFPNGKGDYTVEREDGSSSNRSFDDAADVGARAASFTADNRIDYISEDNDEDEPFQSFASNEVQDRVRERRLKQQPPPMPPPPMDMEDQLPPPPPPRMPPPPEFFDESFFDDGLYDDFDRLEDMDDMMLDDVGMPIPPPPHLDEMPPPGQQQPQQQMPPPPHMQNQQHQQQQNQNHRNRQTQSQNSEEHMKTIPPPPSNPYQMRNKSANARESDNSQNPGYYYAQQPRGTSFISNISKQELEERRQMRRLRREPLLTPESNIAEMDMEMEMEEEERFMREFRFEDERDMMDGGGARFYGNDREYFDFDDIRERGYLDDDRRFF